MDTEKVPSWVWAVGAGLVLVLLLASRNSGGPQSFNVTSAAADPVIGDMETSRQSAVVDLATSFFGFAGDRGGQQASLALGERTATRDERIAGIGADVSKSVADIARDIENRRTAAALQRDNWNYDVQRQEQKNAQKRAWIDGVGNFISGVVDAVVPG